MDTQPPFSRQQLLSHIVGDTARAVSERHDEPQARQFARAQAAARSILAFEPTDAIEAMIASHCVMLHELIVDSVQTTLRGQLDAPRRATRSGIVALDRAFGANLVRLERYRTRHADGAADVEPADICAETEIADRVHRHQAGAASTAARTCPVAPEASAPSPDPIDPGHAGPEVTPPLDGPRPPHILRREPPRDVSPATVAPMPGLNRQQRRAIRRQSGKRIDPVPSPIANANSVRHIHP